MTHPDHHIEAIETTMDEMTDEEMNEFFYLDLPPTPSSQSSDIPLPSNFTVLDANLKVPDYLSSIHETRFVRMIELHVPSMDRALDREDLRQVAILTHHLTVLELERSLWDSYLQCGTGMLQPNTKHSKFWPATVIAMFKESVRVTTFSDVDQIRASDNDCLRFVQRQLEDMDNEAQALQYQLNHQKKQIYDYERIWKEAIRALVVEQTESVRQDFRWKIQLVEFDYRAYRLECEFRDETPSTAQMEQATLLLGLKYQHENARQEVLHFKEQIAQNKLPSAFNALQEPAPHSFRSLSDTQLAQHLDDRQQAILQHHHKEMLDLFLNALEAKLEIFRTLFNDVMDNVQESQHMLSMSDRFSPNMIHLLDQQFALIAEKLECTYRFQTPTFRS